MLMLGPKTRVSTYGRCDLDTQHGAHIFPTGVVDTAGNTCMWSCPGQYAECSNCDDRKCMGCIFREYDHECKNDCPMCCGKEE